MHTAFPIHHYQPLSYSANFFSRDGILFDDDLTMTRARASMQNYHLLY